MINQVTIRNFKRFDEVTFDLPGHIVVAGPNNMGKTTLLQAIAAWGLALNRWKEVADPHKHKGAYTRAPLARQAFSAVPLRGFDLLWKDRSAKKPIEIVVRSRMDDRYRNNPGYDRTSVRASDERRRSKGSAER